MTAPASPERKRLWYYVGDRRFTIPRLALESVPGVVFYAFGEYLHNGVRRTHAELAALYIEERVEV